MRLSTDQIEAIKLGAAQCFGADARVWLVAAREEDTVRDDTGSLARHLGQSALRTNASHQHAVRHFAQNGTKAVCRGFTLIELIMVMVIAGVLAVVAVPRMFNATAFQSRGLADQVQASLRYAQKVAIAQHRFVCVTFTSTNLSLTLGATNSCGTPVTALSSNGNYVVNAPSGISFTANPTAFSFNALGQPRTANTTDAAIAAATVSVTGDVTRTITVEAETGYVHQ